MKVSIKTLKSHDCFELAGVQGHFEVLSRDGDSIVVAHYYGVNLMCMSGDVQVNKLKDRMIDVKETK